MQKEVLQPYLDGLSLGAWRYFDNTGSTNDVALDWVRSGAPDMSLVIADHQSAGRGRFQRRWVTQPGSALAFSLILHPTSPELQHLSHFAALGALAAWQALAGEWGLAAKIKWPNDILLNGQKAAGILVENTWLGDQLQGLVIGLGLNISVQAVPPPEQVMFPATCLENALGHPVDRWSVLRSILLNLAGWRSRLGSPEFFTAWEDNLAFKGEWVRISGASGPEQTGRVAGLSPSGSLRLVDQQGNEFQVNAGDVSLRPVG
jgi:BirA family transcriptional regulator, biotin operon repressor / biotin---[acetyl-CoA-carboxylase] ligase